MGSVFQLGCEIINLVTNYGKTRKKASIAKKNHRLSKNKVVTVDEEDDDKVVNPRDHQ